MRALARRVAIGGALVAFIMGCANRGLVFHSFEFDARRDSPDAEILNYRYGDSKQPGARPPEWALRQGKVAQATATGGEMLRANELYVKWRIRSTGAIFEDTVDLGKRLPRDIERQCVYFVVKGAQLYVYLVSDQRREPHEPANGPSIYHHRKVSTIYPDATK
jgi:hypothetical protein